MTVQSARLASLTIKNLVFPEWWLLWPLPVCFALVALEFVFRFHRLMGAPRTRRHRSNLGRLRAWAGSRQASFCSAASSPSWGSACRSRSRSSR